MQLRLRDGFLPLERVAVMGVLNVTPDSFSDGGLYDAPDRALAHALEMIEQGADIVDVGGESTRPGATPVPEDEEIARVVPVVEALAARTEVPVSIDTRKERVADAALAAGASIVNDTNGEEADPRLWEAAARHGAPVVFMHSRGTPATMRSMTRYDDVVAEVATDLSRRAEAIQAAGVPRDAIVLDPGFGFAKDVTQNLTLLRRLDEIVALGYPVLAGTSRKSFIGLTLDLPENERLEGTAATVAWAVAKGARLVRVHDVGPIVRVVRMVEAIMDAP